MVLPSIGLWVITRLAGAVQLSVECARTNAFTLTPPALQFTFFPYTSLFRSSQSIEGAVLSCTVKATTHWLELPVASLTVTVIGWEPSPLTVVPSIGLWVITRLAGAVQLSVECARTNAITLTTPAMQLAWATL